MKSIAMIPARYAATRFPGKLMQTLGNKTIIRHTYENTMATHLFDEVVVVTDSEIIFNEIVQHGGYAIMSKCQHESGSDRIAEAVRDLEVDIVVNVQGDEPLIPKKILADLLQVFGVESGSQVQVASPMRLLTAKDDPADPNLVKVVVDKNFNSLLFSRSLIPFRRDLQIEVPFYKHVGIYAFRKQALLKFTDWEMTPLEAAEKIECLRYLENGLRLKMILCDEGPISIDTPEDLERARTFWGS